MAEPRPGWAETAGYIGVAVAAVLLAVSPVAALYAGGSVVDPLRPVLPMPLVLACAAAVAALVVALPVLQLVGALRLLRRRGRRLLLASGLPVTAGWGALVLVPLVTGSEPGPWFLLVLLAPFALPPIFALMPSVGRWLATAPPAGRRG